MSSSTLKGFVNKICCKGRMEEPEDGVCQYGDWKLSIGAEASCKKKDVNGRSSQENKTVQKGWRMKWEMDKVEL